MDRAVAAVQPAASPKPPSGAADPTSLRVAINVHKSELELLHTVNEASGELAPLARFTIAQLWLAFRSSAGGRMALALSLPLVEGRDCRNGVPPEHSLVITAAGLAGQALEGAKDADKVSHMHPKSI